MKAYFSSCLVIFLLSLHAGHAQLFRQVDKNLGVFYKLNPSSKISLFFNQPSYLSGDTAYFLTRLVNTVDFRPIKKKTVIHLLLVDKQGKKALDQFVLVEDGFASNQIIIPPTIPPGTYRLLCLKEKSSGPEVFYQRLFEISGGSKYAVVDTVRSISVFPEGGSILEGAENKIFVSARPAAKVQVKVLDGSNNQVELFQTNSNGIGFFFLSPRRGQTFRLSATLKNKSIKVPLPIKEKSGVSFKSIIADGKLQVKGTVLNSHGQPELVLIRKDRVYFAEKLKLDSSKSFFSEITLGETLKGLFQLWIIDVNKVLASRILYVEPGQDDDMLDVKHPIQAPTRSKIEIRVKKIDSLMRGNFSVRVYPKSIFSHDNKNIFSDLEFAGELSAKSFSVQGEIGFDSLNDFLATQQGQRYNADSLYKGKFKIKKPDFDQGYVIKGRCINLKNPELQKPATITFYFENSNFVEEATFDRNGNFSLELSEPIALNEKVYYRIDANDTELIDARIDNSNASRVLSAIQTNSLQAPNPYFSHKSLTDSIQRSYNYFINESNPPSPLSKSKGMEAKLYGADKIYNMADYQPFASMKDIIVEIMGKVVLKKVNGKPSVRIYLDDLNNPDPQLAKEDPLFVVDGIPTTSTEFFLSLNPSKIDKIKIIWRGERSVLKSFGRNGVIVVETKDATSTAAIPALNHFSLIGFSTPLSFWSPQNIRDTGIPILGHAYIGIRSYNSIKKE